MEVSAHLSLSAPILLITFCAVVMSILYIITSLITRKGDDSKKQSAGGTKTVPDAGSTWPLLGHLHLLGGPLPAHLVLAQMADKYGPIFTIRLGLRSAVVVSTWELAKDCLTTNDRAFATRPKSVSAEVMTYNYAMVGLSPYSPYWRHVRKILTLKLLSNQQIGLLRLVRESEVLSSIRNLNEEYQRKNINYSSTSAAMTVGALLMDMKRWFSDVSVNIMLRTIVGRRLNNHGEADEEREVLRKYMKLIGRFVVADGFPLLRWLDLGGHEKDMKRTSEELDQMVQRWLDEHKARRNFNTGGEKSEQDFMDALLSIHEDDGEIGSCDSDTMNKATCMEILQKVQQELDIQIGRDRQVNESDLNNLSYLHAVIKETLRLYPAAPLSLPHEAMEDCNVSGYFISKGTQLILNLYKIQHDPRVWPNPSEFSPERFLTTHKNIDVWGQNFELIPFGSGRRMCPGISWSLQVVGLALASFLHAFDVWTPGDEAVDMEEAMGLTNLKATPLEVLITPRIPKHVYNQ
ncbi:cytochrome P450 82A3-like isoform X2 [Punica granatum]|uniref:Cytochrome P450 82A3-like isoform X2 n=1 Tax=Punica granatum TaxID=22663 RepID=A0A6P8E2C3_PUNGR|nr:cytochrome P450 82A3-like isoform X2 [Punica granatum]